MFYKKNPKVDGVIGVQNVSFDDDTVVEGDEFAMWANPNTFPGWTPSLVVVTAGELTKAQAEALQYYRSHKKPAPPRHLGVITTKNFENTQEGAKVQITQPPIKHEAPAPDPDDDAEAKAAREKAEKEEEERLAAQTEQDRLAAEEAAKKKSGTPVSNFTPDQLVDGIKGVTGKNVAKVMKKFPTVEAIAKASNIDLRSCGIKANFFKAVRDSAAQMVEGDE